MKGPLGTTPLLPVQPGKLAKASSTIFALNSLPTLSASLDITSILKNAWASSLLFGLILSVLWS